MVSGFKSANNSLAKSSKALSIANATALTEKMSSIFSDIKDPRADYVLALKANHPTLHTQVKDWFEEHSGEGFEGITYSYDERVEKGHHRTEKRQIWCVPVSELPPLHNQNAWSGLKCVVMVVRE